MKALNSVCLRLDLHRPKKCFPCENFINHGQGFLLEGAGHLSSPSSAVGGVAFVGGGGGGAEQVKVVTPDKVASQPNSLQAD